MLAGDYYSFEVKAKHSGGESHCRCCQYPSPPENMSHILASCNAYSDIRERMFPVYSQLCSQSKNMLDFEEIGLILSQMKWILKAERNWRQNPDFLVPWESNRVA